MASVLATEGVVIRALAPELDELVASRDGEEPRDLSAFRLRGADRVARALWRIVAAVATEAMVIVTLEDLHWADDGTVAVLRKLLDEPPPARAMFVLTTRPGTDLGARRAATVLELHPLAPEHNDRLLLELTGASDLAMIDALKDAIPLLAAGNPLFNTRIIRDLEQLGHLHYETKGGLRVDLEALRRHYTPPDSVSTLLEHELVPPPSSRLTSSRRATWRAPARRTSRLGWKPTVSTTRTAHGACSGVPSSSWRRLPRSSASPASWRACFTS